MHQSLVKHMKPLEEMRVLQARDGFGTGVDDSQRSALLERIAVFTSAGEQRCQHLREQLQGSEAVADGPRREASSTRTGTRSRR
ncbi:MAG: hypothetical protein M3P53_05430 [Actinomycetota bacterium]|nr:hypothetical protein [Actinomycetota bacterium]